MWQKEHYCEGVKNIILKQQYIVSASAEEKTPSVKYFVILEMDTYILMKVQEVRRAAFTSD